MIAVSKFLNPSAVIAPSLKTPNDVIIMGNHGRMVIVVVKRAWLTGGLLLALANRNKWKFSTSNKLADEETEKKD